MAKINKVMVRKGLDRRLEGAFLGPDFLCIGAPKCGTTWLYQNLRRHPELWLPPVKELHSLDHILRSDRRMPIIFRGGHSRQRAARYLRKQVTRLKNFDAPEGIMWALRYFLHPTDEGWYRSLFPSGRWVTGECTPSYSVMPERVLERLREMLPEVKVVYLLRNPVGRDWSHVAMTFRKAQGDRKSVNSSSDARVLRALTNVERSGRSDYLRNLERWERYFPRESIFVGFFDELEQNPSSLLLRIFQFLGVEASEKRIPAEVGTKVGDGGYEKIPDRFLALLSAQHYERLVALHERFDNAYTESWLALAAERRS